MNKYSKILHHISASDMRQTHLKKLNEKKEEKKLLSDEKEYISSLKFDWRKSFEEGMNTSSVFSQIVDAEPGVDLNVIDVTNGKSFGVHPDGVADYGYSANGLQGGTVIRDSGTGTGSDGGFDIGKHLAFTGDTYYNLRWAALNPIDASALDTIVITAIRGNDVNGGEDPDAEYEDLEVWYRTKDMAQNGWRGINITPDGTTVSGVERKIIPIGSDSSGLRDWSLNLPAHVRTPETQFMLVQNTSSGAEFDHYGVTEIKFRRNTPLNVVVPLDDPKAVSFINYTNEGDPKKRKKKLEDQLKASKEYTDKVLGSDFPGMGATLDDTTASPIGKDQVAQAHKDAGTLSQQLKKALEKDSDATEPTSKSTVDTIKKVSKDGGKTIQYQQTDDITGEPIEEKPEVIATRQSVIATDSDGNEIKPKPVGAGAVQGADATNLDQQEPTESEPTESEPPTDLDQEDAEVEKEAELTDDEKEELKNQGKSEEEIKQEEQNKKDQAKLDNKSNALQRLLDSVIGDVTNDLNGFKNLAKVAKFVVQGFLGMLTIADRLNPFTDNSTTNNDLQGGLSVILNSLDIAVSVMDGEVKKSNPTAAQIQSYKDSILPDLFKSSTKHLIPISDVRHEYADANIYVERIDGKAVVRDNTGGVRQDLTDKDTHGSVGGEYAGFSQVGGGYSQLVIPKDGGEPHIHYYDYNYENLNNTGDVSPAGLLGMELNRSNFAGAFLKSISNIIHQLRPDNTKLNIPTGVKTSLVGYLTNFQDVMGALKTTSTLEGWPPGIHGAALTDITIPLSKLPKETQDMIKAHPLSWTEERISKMTDDQVWDQLSFETAEDVEWFDDNFEKLMEKYHPELYKNHEKWKEVDGKLSDITKQPEYTAAGDAAREYRDSIKENYKELIDNVEKEIPLPEGDYPEWDSYNDPGITEAREAREAAWSTYQEKWTAAEPAMKAYDAHAATLEKRGKYLYGTPAEILKLTNLENKMNALLSDWDKASAAWDATLVAGGKALDLYMKKLEKERKPWDDVYEKQWAAKDKLYAERDKKVEAAQKAYEDTYTAGKGGKLLNGGDWKHPETGKVIPGMGTVRSGLETERDQLGELMRVEQRAYGETLMKEQKAWIWKTRFSGHGDGKSWTPQGGSGGSGGSGKGKPPKNKHQFARSKLALDDPIVKDDEYESYKPRGTFMQETIFDRIKKMRKNFDYEGKPSPDGFPENDPPKLDPKTGMHPRYGKNASRYKKLDPVSARSMPKTGDPETDAQVVKAAKKPK